MAKVLMNRAKFKIQRRLGIELPGLGKPGALERRPYPPGQHGQKRKKLSDYTVRLMEKQKVLFHYGLREGQLRNYVAKSKKVKTRAWVDTLMITLESRLDNIVFRLNFAPSMAAARQLVTHGHVRINGKRVDVPSCLVHPGDKISMQAKGYQTGNYLQAKERPVLVTPAYLSKSTEGGNEVGTLLTAPDAHDVPFKYDSQMLTEFYWKV